MECRAHTVQLLFFLCKLHSDIYSTIFCAYWVCLKIIWTKCYLLLFLPSSQVMSLLCILRTYFKKSTFQNQLSFFPHKNGATHTSCTCRQTTCTVLYTHKWHTSNKTHPPDPAVYLSLYISHLSVCSANAMSTLHQQHHLFCSTATTPAPPCRLITYLLITPLYVSIHICGEWWDWSLDAELQLQWNITISCVTELTFNY